MSGVLLHMSLVFEGEEEYEEAIKGEIRVLGFVEGQNWDLLTGSSECKNEGEGEEEEDSVSTCAEAADNENVHIFSTAPTTSSGNFINVE